MFILKSTHKALLAAERSRCEAVVAQMREQISDLRRLVFVPEATADQTLPIRAANAILDGQEVIPTRDDEQDAKDLAEANRILSGQYDNVEESW